MKSLICETLLGPVKVKILQYGADRLSSARQYRWVQVEVTKTLETPYTPYVKGYRFICGWDCIWQKHRYIQGGIKSAYEGKPQWDPEKTCQDSYKNLAIQAAS